MNLTHSIETVRKLNLNVMGLLAKLGTQITRAVSGAGDPLSAVVGVLPTWRPAQDADTAELAVLLYNSPDSANTTGATLVSLALNNVPATIAQPTTMVAAYALDNVRGSANHVWEQFGRPIYPSEPQWQAMRDGMEVPQLSGFPANWSATYNLTLQLPGVVLLHACAKPTQAPPMPVNVRLHVTTSRTPAEVLVFWDEVSGHRCVSYEVLYSSPSAPTPIRVNNQPTIFRAFLHAQAGRTVAVGCYSIQARDYWGRASTATVPVCV